MLGCVEDAIVIFVSCFLSVSLHRNTEHLIVEVEVIETTLYELRQRKGEQVTENIKVNLFALLSLLFKQMPLDFTNISFPFSRECVWHCPL